jgi:hypothetical protein
VLQRRLHAALIVLVAVGAAACGTSPVPGSPVAASGSEPTRSPGPTDPAVTTEPVATEPTTPPTAGTVITEPTPVADPTVTLPTSPPAPGAALPSAAPDPAQADVTWLAAVGPSWGVGRAVGPEIALPAGEQALAVSSSYVVSVVAKPGQGVTGSTLVVRDSRVGTVLWRVARSEAIDTAAIVGSVAWFTGQTASRTDAGLLRLDLRTGLVRAVVPAARWPSAWPTPGTREALLVSASGSTIGSPVCGGLYNDPPHCWIDLVDMRTGSVRRPFLDIPDRPWLLSDTTVVARTSYPQRLVAYDIGTGRRRWSIPGLASSGMTTRDGRTIVVVDRRRAAPTFALSTHVLGINAATGRSSVLDTPSSDAALPQIWPELSSDAVVAVGDAPLVTALDGVGSASARRIDLATGAILPEPLVVRASFVPAGLPGPSLPQPPSQPATASPYLLAGFPAPNRIRTVRSAADCVPLPTATARTFCAAVLPSDWRVILGTANPWQVEVGRAAFARAMLNGDLSICDDVGIRSIESSPGGAAPPPDLVQDLVGPVQECRTFLWTQQTLGTFDNVQLPRRPGAALPPPATDPRVTCGPTVQTAPFPRAACARVITALEQHYGPDPRLVGFGAAMGGEPCANGLASACPAAPAGGTFIGSAAAGLVGDHEDVFDVYRVGSSVVLVPIASR